MSTQNFKTNIKCDACVAKVTPQLNNVVGEGNWQVDLKDPERTLTIESEASAEEINTALKEVGYEASPK